MEFIVVGTGGGILHSVFTNFNNFRNGVTEGTEDSPVRQRPQQRQLCTLVFDSSFSELVHVFRSSEQKVAYFMKMRPFPNAPAVKAALENGEVIESNLVWSLPAEKVCGDYLLHSKASKQGSLLVVYEERGTGKSCGLEILCRLRSLGSPKKFAIFPNENSNIPSGDVWYNDLLLSLGLDAETDPTALAKYITAAIHRADETDPSFLIPTAGTLYSSKQQLFRYHASDQRPVLVFEDFNPLDLMEPWEDYNPTSHYGRLRQDQTAFGKALDFFAVLANKAAIKEKEMVVFVTTRSKRVANVLQYLDGNTLIAPSLIPNDYQYGKVDFDYLPTNYGFGWDVESREQFLRARFHTVLTANPPKLSHEQIQSAAERTNDSIREVVDSLEAQVCTPTKVPRSHTEETDDLDMDDFDMDDDDYALNILDRLV